MLRSQRLAWGILFTSSLLLAERLPSDAALWKEYGLAGQQTATRGKQTITTYEMKDLTGALAAWEWMRTPQARSCDLTPFCTSDGKKTIITSENRVVEFDGPTPPAKQMVEDFLDSLSKGRDTSLPAILTFLPKEGRVANSARYVLGPVSLSSFAPELTSAKPGFEQGAEAQVASYKIGKSEASVRLALFYYATPEMARIHATNFKPATGSRVKRSGLLVAAVLNAPSDEASDTLLSRVGYEAKITWNETPPPSPIKPMYRLLLNIMYMSILLVALCSAAGLVYGAMRIYRRRYGTLDAQEAMTTLNLSGD